tara:strand:- start:5081 stop:5884 length:804 start_codon:yes stop_codon:yes gene_type:complete
MRNLLKFISRYNYTITFFLLLFFSLFLVSNESFILRSFYFNSSNYLSGNFYKAQNEILSYFSLEKKNKTLINENLELINRLKKLESYYGSVAIDTSHLGFLSAQVINNSLNKSKNYITIDKGFKDGVRENLGVISSYGVIGKVKYVSDNFSTIISLLNTSFYLSTLVDETKTLSSINWDGKSPRKVKLLYVPKHVPLEIGYSVITSSFDSVFPKGMEVGKINNINKETNSNFYDVDILLSEDFYSIYNVYLVKSLPFEEKIDLENID